MLTSLFFADPVLAVLQLAISSPAFSSQLLSDCWLVAVDLSKCLEAKLLVFLG